MPVDISVVGFDDIILAEAFEPALTTVRQPRLQIGRKAMQLMEGILEKGISGGVHELKTQLIVRASVAPRQADDSQLLTTALKAST